MVNVANRAQRGVFGEEDVDRVRLLGLVIALVSSHARLPERSSKPSVSGSPSVTHQGMLSAAHLRARSNGSPRMKRRIPPS